ncbi:MAG: dihydrolipoyllysine-residue acetyltransferase [Porticoccaceae bacterium]|nr:dihydrolipoyllysine-residue acetyltransferase [Porticoccaceae bacterium]
MAVEIVTVPDLGGAESVDVIELSLTPGDSVALEDSLLVLESDKATMDVPSPYEGSLVKYLVAEGAVVKVGDPIAEVEVADVADQPVHKPADPAAAVVADEQAVEASELVAEPQAESIAVSAETLGEQLVVVPDIGSDDAVDVIEISVAVGDQVEEGDTLLVLESDKATMDVPSSHAGKVVKIIAAEGDKLRTGAEVAILEAVAGAAAMDGAESVKSPEPAKSPEPVKPPQPNTNRLAASENAQPAASGVYAGPAVRLLARELGVDLAQVSGTGPRGRVQKDDINNHVKARLQASDQGSVGAGIPQVPSVDFSQFGEIETVAMSKIHKLTAANMQRNWLNVPHVTQFDEADITELEAFRKSLKDQGEKRGVRVTPVSFLIKALAASLQANPEFNRSLAGDGENYIQKHYCHIGMAVDTSRGLVVPVIKNANEKGIWEISAEIASLAASAREGKLKPAEMQGGCFTLSSLGAIGGNGFTPIVNSPEVGILGVSKSQIKPVWDGAEFVPRMMLPLALSYDHRVINGGDAGRFMTYLVKLLSDLRYLAL